MNTKYIIQMIEVTNKIKYQRDIEWNLKNNLKNIVKVTPLLHNLYFDSDNDATKYLEEVIKGILGNPTDFKLSEDFDGTAIVCTHCYIGDGKDFSSQIDQLYEIREIYSGS